MQNTQPNTLKLQEDSSDKEAAKKLHSLFEKALRKDPDAIKEIKKNLNWDEENTEYFLGLLKKFYSPEKKKLWISEGGRCPEGYTETFPASILPEKHASLLPVTQYKKLVEDSAHYRALATKLSVRICKLHAGTGTNVLRKDYLAEHLGINAKFARPRAKSTDLFLNVNGADEKPISLAEAQIVQFFQLARTGSFHKIAYQELVSRETRDALESLWYKKSYFDAKQNYSQCLMNTEGVRRMKELLQEQVPCLNENNLLTAERTAPAGHGFFAYSILKEICEAPVDRWSVIAIGNGEDLSSSPDPLSVAWMMENHIPIAMVTTEKTVRDSKGGQISLAVPKNDAPYATIIEQAQATQSRQEKLFEALGVTKGDKALFNTNLVLLNVDLLRKLLRPLAEANKEQFWNAVAPDLIENVKNQKDANGNSHRFIQLEGAMGSLWLNLDKYYRKMKNQPLVHFLNTSQTERLQFYCPVKVATDHLLQFHSDRFVLDKHAFRLLNQSEGDAPEILLIGSEKKPTYYQELKTLLSSFEGASLRHVKDLHVKGLFKFVGIQFNNHVYVENRCPEVVVLKDLLKNHSDLHKNGQIQLDNVIVKVSETKAVTVESFISRQKQAA